ncbi:MAG TPA: EF-hand domain-containing protein [Bryobacteraceae bacterium]|nr:EF-hand domain-containing protein [Bryobacteraceae bacterium]
MMRPSPLLAALDADRDGTLSAAELAGAPKAILTLDKNGDGAVSAEELHSNGGQRRGPGGPDPLFRAIDTDGDGALSSAEISAASKSLLALDKDADGMLQRDEVRPARMGPGGNPQEMVDRVFENNDANKDGKLSRDEMPERMREMFARADENQDGFVTKDELTKAFSSMGGGRRR